MKKVQVGLVVEGNVTKSKVLRLPNLARELGPVKATDPRVAKRCCTFLHGGYPVVDYDGLQSAALILIHVPVESATGVIAGLSGASLQFKELSFVLCENWLASNVLEPLREKGATVATLLAIPQNRRKLFVIEGQKTAVRQMQRLLAAHGARALEVREGSKPLIFAASLLSISVPLALASHAQLLLRDAGVTGNNLRAILEEMGRDMMRDALKGSQIVSSGPLRECPEDTAASYIASVRLTHPKLARLLDVYLQSANHGELK